MTTITKRVLGSITKDPTKRVSATATESTTRRVNAPASADSTRRVAYNGATPDRSSKSWNDTWANSWGNSWRIVTHGQAASPQADSTPRVGDLPAASITKRVLGV